MTPDRARCAITPATKVADLLDSWPELEDVLIAQAPAFRRLRNPVLRRTVAHVATLEQAAGVGGVPVRDLVAALRSAAGIECTAPLGEGAADVVAETSRPRPPEWLDPARVTSTLDADALLERGRVPLTLVSERVRLLGRGELLCVSSAFRPVPLVEALETQGYRCFVRQTARDRFETFIASGPDSPSPLP